MNRKDFLRYTSLAAAGTFFLRHSALALFARPAGTVKMLRGNVGIYTERGGTIGFYLGEGGIITIDSQFPDAAAHYIEELRKLNDKPFLRLLYTHHHGDHTGGGAAFKELVKDVIAHRNAAAHHQSVSAAATKPMEQLYATITFDEELKLKSDDVKLDGHYFGAAHTNGDAVYHFQDANIAHLGDLLFNRRPPVVDRAHGASLQHWTEVLERIAKKFDKDTLYIFGHAAEGYEVTGSKADLLAFRDYLSRVLDFGRAEIKAGKAREDFVKITSIPNETEWKSTGQDRLLAAVWDELTTGSR
ncbi:MAG: MBL fold metallo-hydrolase [Chitinophagaceae bacterium]|nr:MAG: MBL fold metallo-hydrolase [Chitinophagaceae bacterium]